jgi:hypothetical protein
VPLLLNDLAAEVGRLRRHLGSAETFAGIVAGRIAGRIEALDVLLSLTAAELAHTYFTECGNEDAAVEAALEVVDKRSSMLRRLLEGNKE